ncbi:MAG TPA: inositol monophosphatase family protein [Gemmatimonadales bacterium]|nr:inositol monophosphatase family protein [Gemmatimonadales bacterium]
MSLDNLGPALRAAIAAAQDAAALLRREFHRPGGPRGHDGHADVDKEAELKIRDRLLAAFPEWGYEGEETGSTGPRSPRWLVDPNDGTKAYLKGYRGSAVSIALIVDGLPVLGVVYAPTAPNDAGDLIAWAEGHPLTRNGVSVQRSPLHETLGRYDVVLVSQDGDKAPEANRRCVAPARYRCLPSIAYRLALVAVGDGAAGVSLNHPTGWDLAGGHALLRAVGGELVSDDGAAIRYARYGGGRQVFGGSLSVARELATRPWDTVFQWQPAAGGMAADYPLITLEKGRTEPDAGVLGRAQGCLLGQLAGDALGQLVEFESRAAVRASYPDGVRDLVDGGAWQTLAGQPTDDSELALMLARTLVRDGQFDVEAVRKSYVAWRDSGPFDIGGTTNAGLAGRPNAQSQANGALMRVSPLGIFAHALAPETAAQLARADAAITHPHPACADANAVFVVTLAHAIRHGTGPAETHEFALRWACAQRGFSHPVLTALERARTEPSPEEDAPIGWVLLALQNAFYRLLHESTAEAAIVATVSEGGDADTTGAIAGALAGAVHGLAAIPRRWQRLVLSCRAWPDTTRARPRCFWPIDALETAERLVLAGAAVTER